jgi:hypothetical protein
MARGEDTGAHPGRQVGRDAHAARSPGGLQHPHASEAAAVPKGSHWSKGFVGQVVGHDNGNTYFDAKASGGGSTDSLSIPWTGGKANVGKTMGMMPERNGDGNTTWSAMDLDAAHPDIRDKYKNLPGYR